MENVLEIAGIPVIVGIVYFVMAVYKKLVTGKKEIWTSLIPVWASILGIGLGLVAYFCVPSVTTADNVLSAVLLGLASGLMAVGVNQIYKQASKAAETQSEEKNADGDAESESKQ